MAKGIGVAVLALILGSMASEATQGKGDPKCPGRQTKALYCEQDSAVVTAKEVKAGKHTCGSKVVPVTVCVKKTYACAGKGDKNCGATSETRGTCKCKKAMKAVDGKPGLVTWKCTGCEQTARDKSEIQHDKEKDKAAKRKSIVAVCSHS